MVTAVKNLHVRGGSYRWQRYVCVAKWGFETQFTCLQRLNALCVQLLLQRIHFASWNILLHLLFHIYLTNIAVGHGRSSYVRTLSMTSRAALFQPSSTTPRTSWYLTQHQTQIRSNLHKTRAHTAAPRAYLHLLTHKLATIPPLNEDATGNMAVCIRGSRLTAILTPLPNCFRDFLATGRKYLVSRYLRMQHVNFSGVATTLSALTYYENHVLRPSLQLFFDSSALLNAASIRALRHFCLHPTVTSRRSWRNTLHRLAASSMRSLANGRRGDWGRGSTKKERKTKRDQLNLRIGR